MIRLIQWPNFVASGIYSESGHSSAPDWSAEFEEGARINTEGVRDLFLLGINRNSRWSPLCVVRMTSPCQCHRVCVRGRHFCLPSPFPILPPFWLRAKWTTVIFLSTFSLAGFSVFFVFFSSAAVDRRRRDDMSDWMLRLMRGKLSWIKNH